MAPSYSIIIPTYQRRDVVLGTVAALSAQRLDDFEVIVVVDGSTDGTADALRQSAAPFPLTVLEQPNSGAAKARNTGATAARGRFLLFLDDDMEADPGLLVAHAAAYDGGADAVVGHVPLHPQTPRSFLTDGTARWAAQRARRLAATGGRVGVEDVLTGQLSLRREVFAAVGRFDEAFTEAGTFGNEDSDLGQRLLSDGHRVVYRRDAVTSQRYVVTPEDLLRQSRQLGHADVRYVRKHPAAGPGIRHARNADAVWNRWGWRPLTRRPLLTGAVATLLETAVLRLVRWNERSRAVGRLFALLRDLEYWRGVREATDPAGARSVRILCYHSISDLRAAPVISEYGVPAAEFRVQLRLLRRLGCTFVTADDVLGFLDGTARLPRRPVLITFDDCFTDLQHEALPVLQAERVPAVAFAISGLVGGTNSWDTAIGAPTLRLLDGPELKEVQRCGVQIGAHGRTHRPLRRVPVTELGSETLEAARELHRIGVEDPRLFAYPHGSQNRAVRRATADAGFAAAVTVAPGVVRTGSDRWALPRVEILRSDGSGYRFAAKVLLSALPLRTALHHLHITARTAVGMLARGAGVITRRRIADV